MPWGHTGAWNESLRRYLKALIALRHRHPALRSGTFETLAAEGSVYAFSREAAGERLLGVLNVADEPAPLSVRLEGSAVELLTAAGEGLSVQGGRLTGTVAGRTGALLRLT